MQWLREVGCVLAKNWLDMNFEVLLGNNMLRFAEND